jgi:hypothetical protein
MLLFLFVPSLNLLVDIIDNRICQLILRDNEDGEQQQGSRNFNIILSFHWFMDAKVNKKLRNL